MPTRATLVGESFALGGSTLATLEARVTATDGTHLGAATVDATAMAAGGSLATTTLESSVSSGGDDGSGVLVTTETSGVATGDGACSTSMIESFAITTPGADIGFGLCTSTASGDDYQDAYASTEPYGDITAGHTMETDTAYSSMAVSVGIAVDIA